MWRITFTVAGTGNFPVDMLRYDACHPVDGTSAHNILRPPQGFANQTREVVLVRYSKSDPRRGRSQITTDRWNSMGWSVIDQQAPVKV